MTATLTGERAALRLRRDQLGVQLTVLKATLEHLSSELSAAHDEFQANTFNFFTAKMHVDSAWRTVSYATEAVDGKVGTEWAGAASSERAETGRS